MYMNTTLLLEELQKVIQEAVKVNFEDYQFILKIDTNEDPNKKGVKIQFIPTQIGMLTPIAQDDVAIKLLEKLDQGLSEYGLRVERDRQLKDKSVIGFFIYIEYFSKMVRSALQKDEEETPDATNAAV